MKACDFVPLMVVRFTGDQRYDGALGTALRMNEFDRFVYVHWHDNQFLSEWQHMDNLEPYHEH